MEEAEDRVWGLAGLRCPSQIPGAHRAGSPASRFLEVAVEAHSTGTADQIPGRWPSTHAPALLPSLEARGWDLTLKPPFTSLVPLATGPQKSPR